MRFVTDVRVGAGGILAAALLTGMSSSAHAQSPQDILKKMDAAYKAAKSFQGTVSTVVSGKDQTGKAVSATNTQNIKYKSPNKMRIEVLQTSTGPQGAAMKKAGKQTIVSDGTAITQYSAGENKYVKGPPPPQFSLVQLLRLQLQPNVPGVTLQAPSSVNGRSVFVLKITPRMPSAADIAKLPAEQQKAFEAQRKAIEAQVKQTKPTILMIDKQNFQILKLEQGTGALRSVTTYKGSLNAAIPDSAFSFAIPAGAQEVKRPQTPPGGGGVPQPGAPR